MAQSGHEDGVGIAGIDDHTSDAAGLVQAHVLPGLAGVRGLEYAAGRGPDVVNQGVARLAHDGRGPVARGPDVSVAERAVDLGIDLLRCQIETS